MAPVKKPPHDRHKTFLRNWRDYRGKVQDDVASDLEIDRTTLSKIERGVLPYNQDFLERLSMIYGCEASDLLDIDPLKPDPPKLVYNKLKRAPPEIQARAMSVLEALLKAG
jgi:transcriptional regulator with XRE-family HTH domain